MIDHYKIKKSNLAFLGLVSFYLFGFFFNIRGDYLSGDEMGFLSSFSDRGAEHEFDWRYFFWIQYLSVTTGIHTSLPLIINLLLMIISLRILILKGIFSYWIPIAILLTPTVFYFFNSYLRDSVFMIFSCMLLGFFAHKETINIRQLIAICFGVALIGLLRPFYGLIFASCILFSHQFFRRQFTYILFSILASFVTAVVLIAFNHESYIMYLDFFESGHLRERWEVGVMSIPLDSFTPEFAARNFLLSPLFFWIVPGTGFGARYDLFIYVENIFIALMSVLAVKRLDIRRLRDDRAYRIALLGFMFSLFMAAATTTHQDSYRYRLIFIPFLTYIAFAKRSSWVRQVSTSTILHSLQVQKPVKSKITSSHF